MSTQRDTALATLGLLSPPAISETAITQLRELYSQQLERCHKKITRITVDIDTTDQRMPNKADTERTLIQFAEAYVTKSLKNSRFSSRDLRTLCYNLSITLQGRCVAILSEEHRTERFLSLIENRCTNGMHYGLLHSLLNSWGQTTNLPGIITLRSNLAKKLEGYQGHSPRLQVLRSAVGYLNHKDGPRDLALALIGKRSLHKGYELLGYSEPQRSTYFSEVMLNALRLGCKDREWYIHELNELPVADTSRLLKQIAIINLINAEGSADEEVDFNLALKLMGDPVSGRATNWTADSQLISQERQRFKNAERKLRAWLSRAMIRAFFTHCIDDTRRHNFWMEYADDVIDFKLFGPIDQLYRLQRDEDIKDHIIGRYQKASGTMAAVVMRIGNHQIVEYGDTGAAMYAYRVDGQYAHTADDMKQINNVADLKRRMLAYQRVAGSRDGGVYVDHPEGKMNHKGSWEKAGHAWMNKYVLPYV